MVTWGTVCTTCATLVPVGLYLFILLVLLVARALFTAARAALVYYLELAADPLPQEVDTKFVPFTLLGLLLGTIGALAKLAMDIVGSVPR